MISVIAPDLAVYSLLSSSSELLSAIGGVFTLHNSIVTEDTIYPYIMLTTIDSQDIHANSSRSFAAHSSLEIRVVVRNSGYILANNIYKVIHSILTSYQGGFLDDCNITSFMRISSGKKAYSIANDVYYSISGIYTCIISE